MVKFQTPHLPLEVIRGLRKCKRMAQALEKEFNRLDSLLAILEQMLDSIYNTLDRVEKQSAGEVLLMALALKEKIISLRDEVSELKKKFNQLFLEALDPVMISNKAMTLFQDLNKIKDEVDRVHEDALVLFRSFNSNCSKGREIH